MIGERAISSQIHDLEVFVLTSLQLPGVETAAAVWRAHARPA